MQKSGNLILFGFVNLISAVDNVPGRDKTAFFLVSVGLEGSGRKGKISLEKIEYRTWLIIFIV
jgi:hypothetical protein